MDTILFVNACVRPGSRTLELARTLLQTLDGEVREVCLHETTLPALDLAGMQKRDRAAKENDFSDPVFAAAKAFSAADVIVIAAPYWDLGFPALLKIYIERVCATGITFEYRSGRPFGLCRAKKLTYVTTSGGEIFADFGYSYIKTVANAFFGIKETKAYRAMNLDVLGISADRVLAEASISVIE